MNDLKKISLRQCIYDLLFGSQRATFVCKQPNRWFYFSEFCFLPLGKRKIAVQIVSSNVTETHKYVIWQRVDQPWIAG